MLLGVNIRKPRYSTKLNPFGASESVMPVAIPAEFLASKNGNPNVSPFNPRFKVNLHRTMIYFGNISNPRDFTFYFNAEYGEVGEWNKEVFTFPADSWVDEAYVDSLHGSDTFWLSMPYETDRSKMVLYKSIDFGSTWTLEQTIDISPNGVKGHALFPTFNGIYQLIALDNPGGLQLYKDGSLEQDISKFITLNNSLIARWFDNETETAFFDYNNTSLSGSQEVWYFDGQQIEFKYQFPGDTRPFIKDMIWIPRKNFWAATTELFSGANLYYSFDGGDTIEEVDIGARLNALSYESIGRRSLIQTFNSPGNPVVKSEGFLTDTLTGTAWDDILTAIESDDWHFYFPYRKTRRVSKGILYELENP